MVFISWVPKVLSFKVGTYGFCIFKSGFCILRWGPVLTYMYTFI